MFGRIALALVLISAISASYGWTYYQGRKSGIAEVEQKIAEAVEAERIRMQNVNKAIMEDALARLRAELELKNALEKQNAELDKEADADPSAVGLSSSRLLRINQVRSQQE